MRNYYAERITNNYWYTENDIVIGPVNADIIQGLDPTSLVRKEGQTNWLPAAALFPAQSALPSEGGKALSPTTAVLPTEPPPAPVG
jgi:GYF domain 2